MASTDWKVAVFGPAYLDRVLMADGPLRDDPERPAIDRSAEAVAVEPSPSDSATLILTDGGGRIRFERLPADWPGPLGTVRIATSGLVLEGEAVVGVQSWHDDLGGMGAGFAAALGGKLHLILGDRADPATIAIERLLNEQDVAFDPIHRWERPSDWTLMVSSGRHGDKLPIGFRGVLNDAPGFARSGDRVDLLVVASLSNRLMESALESRAARVKVLAPAIRNVRDSEPRFSALAGRVDVLCLNRGEWLACPDRDVIAETLALLVVTDGPQGARIRFRVPEDGIVEIHVPAFSRERPPADTNRAGETFASSLLHGLWHGGWRGGETSRSLLESVAQRASVASSLQLDLPRFAFPDDHAIDRAVRHGRVS